MRKNWLVAVCVVALAACFGEDHAALTAGEIERVEPPFWWTGFEHGELQLLVRGKGLAAYTPSVDAAGISVSRVERGDSPNYLFVYLDIGA